jgi:DNA-binding MarR family transcriptional regulator
VALLVGKLSDRGLIERRIHPRRRNIRELHLTDSGRDERTKAEQIVSDLEQRIHQSLGDQHYRQLRELRARSSTPCYGRCGGAGPLTGSNNSG